ncbi:MAG TPA: S9 family peptidase [Bdellovibrionota bacterium]|jgi:oligopeptidase B|nr:S9 family peptidase [Bdellovibrionota bacterium]
MKKHPSHVQKTLLFVAVLTLGFGTQLYANTTGDSMSPAPVANIIPHETKLHGKTLVDNYFWLREKENPAVTKYLKAENAHTNAWLKQHKKLEDKLFKEIVSRIREDDESPHYRNGGYMYGVKIKKGQQYVTRFRYPVGQPKKKKVYLDENVEAKGLKFYTLGGAHVSPDDSKLAYTVDTVGFRQYKLYVRDLNTGKDTKVLAEKVGSFAWAADSKTLLYTVEDAAKRHYKVFKYVLGTNPKSAEAIFEEPNERFSVYVYGSLDEKTMYISASSHTSTEIRYAPMDLHSEFRVILPRKDDVEYDVSLRGDEFFVMTNDKSPSFRLATLPVTKFGKWKDLKTFLEPEGDAVFSDFSHFKDHLIIAEKADGLDQMIVYSFKDGKSRRMNFPEKSYSIGGAQNYQYDSHAYRFTYESMISPPSFYDVDLDTLKLTLVQENPPRGKYHKDDYFTDRIFTKASDGTKVPITLVYKKSVFKKNEAPVLIEGYGSYGYPNDPTFNDALLPLLDRGFVFATIHIRGGGEYGKRWHDAGKLKNKMNTFTDFIEGTKTLIREGYAGKDKVFIEGGSAGGLLMGAVTNLEPSLFRGVLSHVPFVDIINSMLDETMPLTVGEFEEWGNPKVKKDFEYMAKYSPYDNLKTGAYPAIWIRTGLHDSQVMYWEPAKYVAKLRTLKTDSTPLYLLTDMSAGHGGASGRYDAYRELAQDYVFILETLAGDRGAVASTRK